MAKKIKVKLLELKTEELLINTEYIKLDQALKFCGIAQTGGHAKDLIEKGAIRVDSEVCTARGKKLYPGNSFEYKSYKYVIKTK